MSINDRYEKLAIKTLPNGKRVYTSCIPKKVTISEYSDTQIVAGDSERIDVIAHNVYGSSEMWWKIANANSIVNGSLFAKPGTTLYIPKG